jgi:hypothetical protein
VIHHSAGKFKGGAATVPSSYNQGKQIGGGNLTGLTLIDFIALPAKARISISYSGEAGAEGFFGLRKL